MKKLVVFVGLVFGLLFPSLVGHGEGNLSVSTNGDKVTVTMALGQVTNAELTVTHPGANVIPGSDSVQGRYTYANTFSGGYIVGFNKEKNTATISYRVSGAGNVPVSVRVKADQGNWSASNTLRLGGTTTTTQTTTTVKNDDNSSSGNWIKQEDPKEKDNGYVPGSVVVHQDMTSKESNVTVSVESVQTGRVSKMPTGTFKDESAAYVNTTSNQNRSQVQHNNQAEASTQNTTVKNNQTSSSVEATSIATEEKSPEVDSSSSDVITENKTEESTSQKENGENNILLATAPIALSMFLFGFIVAKKSKRKQDAVNE